MNIELYKMAQSPNTITKKLTLGFKFENCIFKKGTSILNPIITVSGASDVEAIIDNNYVKIPKLSRYYFVTDIIILTGGTFELHCKVDVLYSFKDDILASIQLVTRQENKNNKYITDGRLPMHSDNIYIGNKFGDSVTTETNNRIILKTTGK